MAFNNNIHIAILGPVSAGKSTFLNSLFSNTFSDMKRKKTTMLPQIYMTTNNTDEIVPTDKIYQMNHESNERILKLREENKYTQADFKELIYNVSPIPDFINLPDKSATYSILDMPGLNCGGGDNMYFNYIQQNSKDIDIYILVFDINSGLNTTDEVNILTMIAKEIEKNKHGFVHILINKCDDVVYEEDKFTFTDDELQELYDRCIETSNKYIKDIRGKITISPLCSSDLYVFRGIKNNIESIDEKHLDKIIMNECGKKELIKLKTVELKRKFIQGLIKEKQSTMYSDWMKDTGYNLFQNNLNDMLNTQNYIKIIEHHIMCKLMDILAKPITDFDIVSAEMVNINASIQQLTSVLDNKYKYKVSENIKTIIQSITLKIDDYLSKGIDSYSASTVEIADTFIDKIGKFFGKIKNLFNNNPFENTQEKLHQKRVSLLNLELAKKYNPNIFKELINRKLINMDKYKESIENTMKVSKDDPYITTIMIALLDSVNKITKNDTKYIIVIIERFHKLQLSNMFWEDENKECKYYDYLNGTDKPIYHASFIDLLTKVASLISNEEKKIGIIIDLLDKYIKPTSTDDKGKVEMVFDNRHLVLYNQWINTNMIKINKTPKIGYIYYKIKGIMNSFQGIKYDYDIYQTLSYDGYVNINNRMVMIYETLKEIFNNYTSSVPTTPSSPTQAHIPSTDNLTVDSNVASVSDKFVDAEDHSDNTSEEYDVNDEPAVVYKKATHNAKVRMNKTLKKADN
jgi:GTPase Era involved in 16S rRNA processing